jgi:hypothetical protein
MTATSQYFVDQIVDTVSKALGLSVVVELHTDEIAITAKIEGPGADTAFWKAVKEQAG